MLGEYGESYLPLGSLHLAFKHGPATDYMRELDLEQATARVAYTAMARPTSGSIWPASRPGDTCPADLFAAPDGPDPFVRIAAVLPDADG